jgi:hypothetical protein
MIGRLTTILCLALAANTLLDTSKASATMAPFEIVDVDWSGAIAVYKALHGDVLSKLRVTKGYQETAAKIAANYAKESFGADLQTINAISSTLRPNIYRAGSPVLLPFEMSRLANEMILSGVFTNKGKTGSYFGPLKSLAFHPGPYGYRAYFRLKKTSTVMISGSSILFHVPSNLALPQLEPCRSIIETAQKASGDDEGANDKFFQYLAKYDKKIGLVDAEYFGETEAAVPCVFAGALIEVHILCDSIGDPDCKVRDTARSILSRLTFVGGSPRPKSKPNINDPIQKLAKLVESLENDAAKAHKAKLPVYSEPGDLLPGSGVNGKAGSRDSGVYGFILFPTDLRASAQTVVYRADQNCLPGDEDKGSTCIHAGTEITKAPLGQWRDNFCEARSGNRLFMCPEGRGHAGQDVWGKDWKGQPGMFPLRAVIDGIAFRRFPAQPAVTVSDVNGTNIDYIYRHMRPSGLSQHGIAPSEAIQVSRGCTLALADRLQSVADKKTKLVDNGISYVATAPHLHFEIRVPTRSGFQHVSPYWTLVQAHRFAITKVDTGPASSVACGPKL